LHYKRPLAAGLAPSVLPPTIFTQEINPVSIIAYRCSGQLLMVLMLTKSNEAYDDSKGTKHAYFVLALIIYFSLSAH
jgi:hypothetical protein